MWGRIFNTAADKIKSGETTSAQLTFSAPENDQWYVTRAIIKNVFDEDNITGEYLTSSTVPASTPTRSSATRAFRRARWRAFLDVT